MFSRAVTTFVVLATALTVAGAPGLSLKVNGPAEVDGVDNFKVTTTITNTGDETLRILNDPLGPLSKLPANTFAITNEAGASAAFGGIKAKFSPKAAAAAGAFTVLTPGQFVQVDHDLSEAYNLTATGTGTYDVEPRNMFYLVDKNGELSSMRATLAQAHSTRVKGKLASTKQPTATLSKRATYVSCTAARQSQLVSAASSAQSYAYESQSYLAAYNGARYVTWFGAVTATRKSTTLSHFTAINGNSFSSFTYDCTCTDAGTYAYVYPAQFGRIYLCGAFWNAPNTGTDSKAGTLVHEASHFTSNGGTDDYVYGQTGARNLAINNPNNAVFNADNHEYFAENNPFQS